MDKETCNQNFIHWDKADKDALCDAMDNTVREAVRNGDSWHRISEVIESLYETFPGLKEYKAERFKLACPSGEVFGSYMPIPEVECLPCPDTTIAKAIDKDVIDPMNDTQSIRRQIRRIEFHLQSIENKLSAYDRVSKAADSTHLMSIGDILCRVIGELEIVDQYKMKGISMLSEEIDENN